MNKDTNTPSTPNHYLRRERQERGWSLQRVADEIQAHFPDAPVTGAYVGRWERGIRKPGPYYQEKLCIIYRKSASQLGLVPKDDEHDLSAVHTSSSENMVQSEEGQIFQISQRSNPETDSPQEQENVILSSVPSVGLVILDTPIIPLTSDITDERIIVISAEVAKISMSEALWMLAFLDDLTCDRPFL